MAFLSLLGRMVLLFEFTLCMSPTIVSAEEPKADPFSGPNCNVQTPPAQAGEVWNDDWAMVIYPRASDMPINYTGCQVAWTKHVSGERQRYVTAIVNGRVEGVAPPPPFFPVCEDDENANKGNCRPRYLYLWASMPHGCAKRARDDAGRVPKDCTQGLLSEWALLKQRRDVASHGMR